MPDADVQDRLVQVSGGWRYYDAAAGSEEMYDATGRLLGVTYADRTSLTYAYSNSGTASSVAPVAGLIISVQDQWGHSVQFGYEQPAMSSTPRIYRIIEPSGTVTGVSYDATGNLAQFTWPDGKTRQYLYERSDLKWAVTGIVDENASRLATYVYDPQGRAIDTQWTGGADHYAASYATPPSWNIVETYDSTAGVVWRDHYWALPQGTTITDPYGNLISLDATLVNGMPRLSGQSQPAGSGCAASSKSLTYDGNGNKASEDDFNGSRACYGYDLSRNLETARVEGLAGGASGALCSGLVGSSASSATLPAGSRKTSTVWHPDWRLEAQKAEPGKLTTSVYNGQPDPMNANALASCVVASPQPQLPDGKPIAVLCKQVEQATSDTDGHLGFSAALQTGVPNRVRSWTYNQYGQVLTERDPLGNMTTSVYYADTSFTGADPYAVGHTMGDLQTVTNALGKVTTYTQYDKHGNVLRMSDANGVETVNTYDLRQRLLSTSIAGQTTGYTYDAAGQLLRVTAPDASWIGYEYDAAHRRVATKDNLGNRIDYTLDNAGNETAQAVSDPAGNLARSLARSFDALGRVQQTTGRN